MVLTIEEVPDSRVARPEKMPLSKVVDNPCSCVNKWPGVEGCDEVILPEVMISDPNGEPESNTGFGFQSWPVSSAEAHGVGCPRG
jgi:hypothetical protein